MSSKYNLVISSIQGESGKKQLTLETCDDSIIASVLALLEKGDKPKPPRDLEPAKIQPGYYYDAYTGEVY